MAGPWDTVPAPNYAAFDNSGMLGNALGSLVSNFQQAQQGQQRTQANDLRNQSDQMLLQQQKAFAGGVPMNPDGTPNYSAIMKTLAEKGDINSISALAPIIQQQQNLQGANAPDPILGGGYSNGGSSSRTADAIPSDGSTADTLADNLATRIESKGQSDPYDALGPVTKSGDRAYGKYQVMGENIPSWTKEILGVEMTPDEFLADPTAQDKVARAKLGQYIQQTGSPQDAASMWFTGKPLAQGANLKDQNGVSGSQYASTATAGMGGGAATQVASAYASDNPALASPDKPAIPPVSAAAGSSIPRSNAATAAGAVGAQPSPTAVPQQLAANNPAWGGINAALPVGPSDVASPAAPASRAPGSPAQGPVASIPQMTASGPAQGSIDTIASAAGLPPQVTANIAKALGVDAAAPLTPQQAAKAKTIIQNYAQRAGQQNGQQQQQAPAGQGQPQGGGPIVPQFPLPAGIKDPQQAILAIDQDINRLALFTAGAGGEVAREKIRQLEWQRDQILRQSAPMDVHPGQTILDPRTGRTLFQAPLAGASNVALQRFLSENPDATAEQIQQFMQAGRGGARSGVGMYMQRYLQENPNASAEDVAKAAQDFQSQGSSLTKFDTGKQGDAVRSFNVLVDHLGTLGDAASALKNGNIQVFNRLAQGWAKQTGAPAPTDFAATRAIVGDELVKAIVGGGGALGDREEIKGAVDAASSPQQLAGVINKYKELALGQLKGLRKQYESSTGRDDFDTKLAPGTRAFFGDKSGDKAGESGAQDGSGVLPPGWTVEVH